LTASTGGGTGRTAILVIHGIGEQNPYETLDSFARGFARCFEDRGTPPSLRPERIAHADWTEVAVHLEFSTPATERGLRSLSLFEYYWAPHTQGQVTYRGVLRWLVRTGLTPLRYLGDNLQALQAAQTDLRWTALTWLFLREMMRGALGYLPVLLLIGVIGLALSRTGPPLVEAGRRFGELLGGERHRLALGAVIVCWTMAIFLGAFLVGRLWERLRRPGARMEKLADPVWVVSASVFLIGFAAAGAAIGHVRGLDLGAYAALAGQPSVLGPVFAGLVALFLRRILIGYLGDVTVYVAADQKAASYRARSGILTESSAALARLLVGQQYDQVILAGHSLGSVIAYDTVNEVLSQVWAAGDQSGQKPEIALTRADLSGLKGLVTFGSPLDKIFYFFREHVRPDQAIRAQILSFLHSFRRGRSGRDYGKLLLTYARSDSPGAEPSAFPTLGTDFVWLNVWSPMDPVSGPLRFYRVKDEDRLCRWYRLWGAAHLDYWTDKAFYEFMARRLL
jgi:hypothetical protein